MNNSAYACLSTRVTADAQITAANTAGLLYGMILLSGTADSKIAITNGSGGTIMAELTLNGTTNAGDTSTSVIFPEPVMCSTDIYADWGGTAAVAYVYYRELG